jgi:hypothetical protein
MERRAKVNACRELARRSGQMISMDPDRWGENMLDSMESGLTQFLGQLPEEVRDEYEDRYIEKYKEWLYAMSRCFSQMITGAGGWKPATFRRHEKTNAAEKAARERLDQWCEKVIKRCNRQERLTGWAEVERLQDKLDNLTKAQEMMKAANKIVRNKKLAEVEQVDELVALGFNEKTAILILHPKYDFQSPGFASYQLSLNLAKIKDTEAKMKRHAAMASKEDSEKEYAWGTLRIDYSDERYRFIFDGKPEQNVIDLMKNNAFKWSRANGAWQRQITPNATYAVKRMIKQLNEMKEGEQ